MRAQHVRHWCRYFGAGQPDNRDNDRNGRPSTYRTDVNGEQVGELILENRQVPIPDLSAASENTQHRSRRTPISPKCVHAGYRDV